MRVISLNTNFCELFRSLASPLLTFTQGTAPTISTTSTSRTRTPRACCASSRTSYRRRRTRGIGVSYFALPLWTISTLFSCVTCLLSLLPRTSDNVLTPLILVWIMGHVLSGWDGTNPFLNPTNLFYQMCVFSSHFMCANSLPTCSVDRFSPHVIANIFWGHTHEDQMSVRDCGFHKVLCLTLPKILLLLSADILCQQCNRSIPGHCTNPCLDRAFAYSDHEFE